MRGKTTGRARTEASRRAAERAGRFLARSQLPAGGFRMHLSTDFRLGHDSIAHSSPLVTTFVLHSLRLLPPDPDSEAAIEKALEFLLREQDERGFWRNRTGDSPERSLVTPDVDHTSCASWVLSLHGRGFKENRTAVAANRDCEGRFTTWLGPPEESNDVDGVVNANVALYLGDGPETAAACQHLERLLDSPESELGSWYYPDPLALDYAVSRAAWRGVRALTGCRDRLLTRVTERCRTASRNRDILAPALAALTLLNCAAEVELLDRQIELVLESQSDDGSWPQTAFNSGPRPPAPRSVWFGSEELTTALCLEALTRYSPLD